MTLDELKNWMKDAKCIDTTNEFRDKCDNYYYDKVFLKDGKLYTVYYLEDHPVEKWGDKGYMRGVYDEPEEVVRKTRMVEETYYEEVNPTQNS